MGCLSSDLLTIHQGQYIVRSVAQLGSTVLATGMASASDIEAAEDRSKVRALEALGFGLAAGAGSNSSAAFSNALLTPPLSNPEPVLTDASPTPLKSSKDRLSLSELGSELETEIVSSSISLPKIGAKPGVPESSVPSATKLTGSEAANLIEDEPLTVAESTASNRVSNSSDKGRSVEPIERLEDEVDRFALTTDLSTSESGSFSVDSIHSVESPLASEKTAVSSPSAAKSDKAGKSSKRKPETFELPPAPLPSRQPSDRSEEIMKIGIEMKRLGWSTEQGREYLKRTYGKRSRQELDDAELLDFLRYLETQPASVQAPF